MSTPFFGSLTITSNDSGSPLVVQLSASAEPVGPGGSTPKYQLDTSGLINLTQWTVNKTGYAYYPETAPNPITNILLWKMFDPDASPEHERILMTNFSSSGFNIGDFLDISMWITASAINSVFFCSVLGGSGSVLTEIPTLMQTAYQSGSPVFGGWYITATSSMPPNDTHPTMSLHIFSATESVNQYQGPQFSEPASSSAVFYLKRAVNDQEET
jgi:hypothetical protein